VSNHWAKGGAGARALAEAVVAICEGPSQFKFLYDLDLSIGDKIEIIGKEIYGADGIELSDLARTQIDTYTRQGYSRLPSMSPLHYRRSLFDNESLQFAWRKLNIPSRMTPTSRVFQKVRHSFKYFQRKPTLRGTGFTLLIRAVRLSAGAGFLYPILGDMQTMPGLGTRPGRIKLPRLDFTN